MPNPLINFKKMNDILLDELKNNQNWILNKLNPAKDEATGRVYEVFELSLNDKDAIYGRNIKFVMDNLLTNWTITLYINGEEVRYYGGEVGTFALQLKTLYEYSKNLENAFSHLTSMQGESNEN